MSKENMTPDQLRFIDDMVVLMQPWGMTAAVSRLYGYLLLQHDPASLDQMCEQLGISKSTASVAARHLEESRLVRRHSERGSKRALYSIAEGGLAAIHAQVTMLGDLGELMQRNLSSTNSETAARRMEKISRVCFAMQGVIQQALRDMNKIWDE